MTNDELEYEAKKSLFFKICDLYSEGEPLKETLEKYNIKPRIFAEWLNNSEWKMIFDISSQAFMTFQDQNIKLKALKAFEKLVTGFVVEELSEEFSIAKNGDKRITRSTVKEKHFPPNVHAVILALQKLIPTVYSDPAKLLPAGQKEEEEQIYKIGDQIIKFR